MRTNEPLTSSTQQTALPTVSVQPLLCTLSDRYASRGIVRAVQKDAEEQRKKEAEAYALAPEAYRVSHLSEEAFKARYCHGEEADMTVSDLVSYFDETRAMRLENTDALESAEEEEASLAPVESKSAVSETVKQGMGNALMRIVHRIPKWFDARPTDTTDEKKTFPLSAFATIAAIAASLMLIVISSVMVTLAESRVDSLQEKIDTVVAEVADINADLNVQHDLLKIRQIAMKEYGMVSEEYVRMDYVSLASEDKVENFKEEKEESVGLSPLLSAIGAQKQN